MHLTFVLSILSSLAATTLSQELIWGDTAACEGIANGRGFASRTKNSPGSCDVICNYVDGSTDYAPSPDGQICYDEEVVPAGKCKAWKCELEPVG